MSVQVTQVTPALQQLLHTPLWRTCPSSLQWHHIILGSVPQIVEFWDVEVVCGTCVLGVSEVTASLRRASELRGVALQRPRLDLCVGHVCIGILNLREHKFALVLHQELSRALHIDKQRVHLLDILYLYLDPLSLRADERGGND